jgi:hypothetical protein
MFNNVGINNYNSSYYSTAANMRNADNSANPAKDTTSNAVTNSSASSGSNGQEYLKKLCEKFSNLNITVGNYRKGMFAGSGTGNVMISPEYMTKAANNPKVSAELEKTLNGIPAALSWFKDQCKAKGMEVISSGDVIDKDGNMSGWAYTRTTSGAENNSNSNSKTSSKHHKKTDIIRLLNDNQKYREEAALKLEKNSKASRIKQLESYSDISQDTSSNLFNQKA